MQGDGRVTLEEMPLSSEIIHSGSKAKDAHKHLVAESIL